MSISDKREERREALLEGISQNVDLRELAASLGVRRGALIRDMKTMRRQSDPGFLEAQRLAQVKVDAEKRSISEVYEKRFKQMTGMSIGDKTFLNMVFFYRSEILGILNSRDSVAAIRDLPSSVRRTLMHNEILVNRVRPEVSKRARDALL